MRNMILELAGPLSAVMLLAACAGQPPEPAGTVPAPTSPSPQPSATAQPPASKEPGGTQPAGTSPTAAPGTQLGPIFVDEAELVMLESYPVQVRLVLRGSLPNPCSELVWQVEPPDEDGRILVQAYSLQESELDCIQVLQPLDEAIPLGAFTQGRFSVWLNGEQVGEFEL